MAKEKRKKSLFPPHFIVLATNNSAFYLLAKNSRDILITFETHNYLREFSAENNFKDSLSLSRSSCLPLVCVIVIVLVVVVDHCTMTKENTKLFTDFMNSSCLRFMSLHNFTYICRQIYTVTMVSE